MGLGKVVNVKLMTYDFENFMNCGSCGKGKFRWVTREIQQNGI